jgi:hypothetical protein
MAWHSEADEQVQQDWLSRSAKKRAELSLSIEETLADNALIDDPFLDEVEESSQVGKSSMIIAPRLSLQSKPIPVVRVELNEVPSITSHATTDSVEVPQTVQKKRRLAGRTTKVHLQAVPKSEKKTGRKVPIETEKNASGLDGEEQIREKKNSRRTSSFERSALAKRNIGVVVEESLAGSAVLKRGQGEVVVTNGRISTSSVVVVTLVEDPGPVVIKYVTLRPQIGFTIHFSAPAEADARLNYMILMEGSSKAHLQPLAAGD